MFVVNSSIIPSKPEELEFGVVCSGLFCTIFLPFLILWKSRCEQKSCLRISQRILHSEVISRCLSVGRREKAYFHSHMNNCCSFPFRFNLRSQEYKKSSAPTPQLIARPSVLRTHTELSPLQSVRMEQEAFQTVSITRLFTSINNLILIQDILNYKGLIEFKGQSIASI